ncbi:hypothetical protein [Limosilactobacillus caecicola]|uniref:hypothetical protein n=1 Tax=Limosilactobacillus caecicola TaxID=2941332 RepID=UPI002042299F|nr:hypothetical protein [Limosilactobacillus caecicola]
MSSIFVTIITVIFIAESFWEFRLFSFLTNQATKIQNTSEREKLARALKLDRRWNWASWILIFIIFITPSATYLPLVSLLCLLETLMVMRLDRVKRRYFN